ncbi:MAG: hypothetical protein AAGK23_13230 [Pseudomonadota bacterium]
MAHITINRFVGTLTIETLPVLDDGSSQSPVVVLEDTRLTVSRNETGRGFVIDGHYDQRPANCIRQNDELTLQFAGEPRRLISEFPVLHIQVPQDAVLDIDFLAGDGRVERVAGMQLSMASCASLQIDRISDNFDAVLDGSPSVVADYLGKSRVRSNGAGRLMAQSIAGGLELAADRAGRITVGHLAGDLRAELGGAARLNIGSGESQTADITLDRSARIEHNGAVGTLNLETGQASRMVLAELKGDFTGVRGRAARLSIGNKTVRAIGEKWSVE